MERGGDVWAERIPGSDLDGEGRAGHCRTSTPVKATFGLWLEGIGGHHKEMGDEVRGGFLLGLSC